MSWDVPYTVAMAERLEEYEPRWLEEPVMPDKIESYAAIRRQVRSHRSSRALGERSGSRGRCGRAARGKGC